MLKYKLHNVRGILSPRGWVVVVALAWLIAPVGVGDVVPLISTAKAQTTLSDPEDLRVALLDILKMQQETMVMIGNTESQEAIDRAFELVEQMTTEDLGLFEGLEGRISDLHAGQNALNQQLEVLKGYIPNMESLIQQSSRYSSELQQRELAGKKFTPLTAAGYGAICSSNPFGDPANGPNRANPDAVQAAGIANFAAEGIREAAETVRDIAGRACDQTVVVCPAPGGGNLSTACIVADGIFAVAKGVEIAARSFFYLLTFCDATIDGAEIEGAYERAADIYNSLGTHDTDLKAALGTHDTDLKAALGTHDADLKTALGTHDADLKTALGTHDTDLKAALAKHDANIDGDLATHDTDIKALLTALQASADANSAKLDTLLERQLETIRLLHTPQGQRKSDVPACNGGPCAWPEK